MPCRRALAGAWEARAEVGAEHDSNPSRVETVSNRENERKLPSAALRGLLGLDGSARLAPRTVFSLSSKAALRRYAEGEAQNESLLILQGAFALAQGLSRSNRLVLATSYYEAFQDDKSFGARDFRSLAPSLNFAQDVGQGRISLGGGYRDFRFKPNPQLDFSGPTAALSYRLSWGPAMQEEPENDDDPDWDLVATTSVERRTFVSGRCIEGDLCPPQMFQGARVDDFTAVGLDLTRTSDFLVGVGGALQLNNSNSFGDGLWRALAHVEGSVLLPWQLSISARAELVWTRYDDEVPLRRDPVSGLPVASIEDESRSTLRVEVMRSLSDRFEVSARWIAYTNEVGGGTAQYRRQTFLLQLGAVFGAF